MAHKKGMGSTRNGRDSESKRLGAKKADGQFAKAGNILVRQRGTKIHPGKNVRRGSDDTLYAVASGIVKFSRLGKDRKQVSIIVDMNKEEKVAPKKVEVKEEVVATKAKKTTAKATAAKKEPAKKATAEKKTTAAKKTTTKKAETEAKEPAKKATTAKKTAKKEE